MAAPKDYVGITDDNRVSEPGTYEAACRWLDEQQPDKAMAMAGFNLSFWHPGAPPGQPAVLDGSRGFIRHERRYRNYLDIPQEWMAAGLMVAPGGSHEQWQRDIQRRYKEREHEQAQQPRQDHLPGDQLG